MMRVHELIKLLKEMPQFKEVYIDNGHFLESPVVVEQDSREYVIIRSE